MDRYVETRDDNGGVHINSGIPNKAFSLAAVAVGGSAAEGAGRIWYAALTSGGVAPDAGFGEFAAATVAAAGDHADVVRDAWERVGVTPGTAATSSAAAASASAPAGLVVVRRSGGITGQVVERVDLADKAAAGGPQPDRYVYEVGLGEGESYTVQEVALDADTRRLMELVLQQPSDGSESS